jgi:hypothetical protein
VQVLKSGEGPVAVPVIFFGAQRVEGVDTFRYLGQKVGSDCKVKGEVSRKLGLASAYAPSNRLGKLGV